MITKTVHAALAASLLALPVSAATMYVHDVNGELATVDTSTGNVSLIGSLGVQLTDIAFDPTGQLFGVSGTNLYSVNSATAQTSVIGSLGVSGATGLVFGTDGTLYMASEDTTELYTVNTSTGSASSLGDMGFSSGGDLAFVGADLFMASTTETLISIDLGNLSNSSTVGSFGVNNVYGIATAGGTLFGTAGQSIFQVDPSDASVSNSVAFGGGLLKQAYGQAFFDESGAQIPIPAPIALLLGGLALLGALGRRRPA